MGAEFVMSPGTLSVEPRRGLWAWEKKVRAKRASLPLQADSAVLLDHAFRRLQCGMQGLDETKAKAKEDSDCILSRGP